ncbi:MAG: DEAD/DEAH box helicase family protein [Acidimicrobiaceae bacterium]|nr:DEAD/DEAH box helicase family protein [Acidimicrobiaceae bacterium]
MTNIHQLAQRVDHWLTNFAEDFSDLILIDEGHHNAAPKWQTVFDCFPDAKIVSFPASSPLNKPDPRLKVVVLNIWRSLETGHKLCSPSSWYDRE